jgi:hypothetical protein
MYCNIIQEACRESLGEISLKKMAGKQNRRGKVFIVPLDGVEIFQGSVENPLGVLGIGESCFKTLIEYCENVSAGSA